MNNIPIRSALSLFTQLSRIFLSGSPNLVKIQVSARSDSYDFLLTTEENIKIVH